MAKQSNLSSTELRKKNPEPLSDEKMETVCRRITRVMETEKLFLKPDLSLWELSRATGYSVPAVSRSINRYMGMGYFDLLNRLRIEEAKRLLRGMAQNNVPANITLIGRQSGFRSRSTFFARFVEYEKMSPKRYMKLYCDKRSEFSKENGSIKK